MRCKDNLVAIHGRDLGRHLNIFAIEEYIPPLQIRKIPIQRHAKADGFLHIVDKRFKRILDRDNLDHASPPPL